MKFLTILFSIFFLTDAFATNLDGEIGTFKQRDSLDCFFLASLIAVANDKDGKVAANSLVQQTKDLKVWQVTFPSYPEDKILITVAELAEHRLTNLAKRRGAKLVAGDSDVKLLEIAADRIWLKYKIKPEGLWDDVSMNSFYMFSKSSQKLIWNRDNASSIAIQDVEKYKRLPPGTVTETRIESVESAKKTLVAVMKADTDGISMVLLDYQKYHGVAITGMDFDKDTYSYIDPLIGSEKVLKGDLNTLLKGMADGSYAINCMEFK